MNIQVLVKLGVLLDLFSITVCDPSIYSLQSLCTYRDPCFTLQQFAASTSKYLRNQTILQLSTGYHNLSSRLKVVNAKIFSITSEAKESIIICYQHSGFYFQNVEMVNMNNITLIRCGGSNAVINISQTSITITDCTSTHSYGIVILQEAVD